MNKRINKLYEQSLVYEAAVDHLGIPYVAVKQNPEKFAELIVRECANVCMAQHNPANLNYKPSEKFAEEIKSHFGLK